MFVEPNPEKIKENFGKISRSYDRANDAMTLGLLRLWRKKLIDWSEVQEGHSVLDVATGTGDLALSFKKKVGESGKVTGLDLTPEMIEIAEEKAARKNRDIDWVVGDSMNLDYDDQSFDVVSIGFGIRNIQDPKKALAEMARVTRPGGKVLILEMGSPSNKVWKAVYGTYFRTVIPQIGGLVSGHPGPYRFLQRSSLAFPSGLGFLEWMSDTCRYSDLNFQSLFGGVAYLYRGQVK